MGNRAAEKSPAIGASTGGSKSSESLASGYAYRRHEPEKSVLYGVVAEHWNTFVADAEREADGRGIPTYVKQEFEAYLKCGILQYGFLRVRCESCTEERLVAFSCKKRGFCPSCGGRRMSETAAKLTDQVIPRVPVRQWVLSIPIAMRYWCASNPKLVTSVLEIIIRGITGFYQDRAKAEGIHQSETGAITFVQRFGSALNLNVHYHILFLDGVYRVPSSGAQDTETKSGSASDAELNLEEKPTFVGVKVPSAEEIRALVGKLADRILRHLQRKGYLKDDETPSGEGADPLQETSPLFASCVAASIQNKTALGDRAGQRVRRLGVHPLESQVTGPSSASDRGFSLHAGVVVRAKERDKRERLIRYVARPSLALERLEKMPDGNLHYRLKKIYSDGTTHVKFSPLELIEKLVALIPRPRMHLVRYHGVLAPNASLRSRIVPKVKTETTTMDQEKREVTPQRIAWAKLLKRVFDIDISKCFTCQGPVKVIAAVQDPAVIARILEHLKMPQKPPFIAPARAPPQGSLAFGDF